MLQSIQKHNHSIIEANKKKRIERFYKNSRSGFLNTPTRKIYANSNTPSTQSNITTTTINTTHTYPLSSSRTKPKLVSSISTQNSIIPLNIFQTWYTLDLPRKMKENVERLKQQNPEFTHYLYNDAMCRDFIQEHFDEDVLWTFDKLKPGAYKADLWRYCVLYIHGGIYLDIKMKSVDKFKLIELTYKEYFPQDRFCDNTYGIWQGLLVCLPHNEILYKSIMLVCNNVKHNIYGISALAITGPHMICQFINVSDIKQSPIRFDIKPNDTSSSLLYFHSKLILCNYDDYRHESIYSINKSHYSWLWDNRDIYLYPCLKPNHSVDFSKMITREINHNNIPLFSGTPTILPNPNNPNEYIVNLRWINYNYNDNGSKNIIPSQWISLNSRFIVDFNFENMSNEVFLSTDWTKESNCHAMGIEDIRVIQINHQHYFLATGFHPTLKLPCVVSNNYDFDENTYNLNKTFIVPSFYDFYNKPNVEKNWAMFYYNSTLCVVYKWYPLQIGQIDYDTCQMNILKTIPDMPDYFLDARCSTIGCIFHDEIWFVLHKSQNNKQVIEKHYSGESPNKRYSRVCFNYQHFFAVFDLNMNLKRYSELFKFGDKMVEFCTGMIMEETRLILSYSLLDTNSYVSTYDYDTIHCTLKWYKILKW